MLFIPTHLADPDKPSCIALTSPLGPELISPAARAPPQSSVTTRISDPTSLISLRGNAPSTSGSTMRCNGVLSDAVEFEGSSLAAVDANGPM